MDPNHLSIEDMVLANLSYFEPMRFEEIILDFDSHFLEAHPDFDREKLMKILDQLVKARKVKLIKGKDKNNYQWQRIYPKKRPFWKFWG